jgi:hypothetical protein
LKHFWSIFWSQKFEKSITRMHMHSNTKFRVFATETFRNTTFTKISSSKFLPETSGFWTKFEFSNRNFGFLNQNFGFLELKLRIFESKLRVIEPKLCVFENRSFVFLKQSISFCKDFFFLPTETSGVLSGTFCFCGTSEY